MNKEYKAETEEIKQYKERLRIALNAARICIFEVDLLRQSYTFFENAEAIFGISGNKILKEVQPFSELEPEAYRLRVSEYFSHPEDAEVIEKAFASIFKGEPTIYEARMKAGSSDFVWCRIHVTPILENGKAVKMIGVITDITDIKERTDQLKQAANLDSFTGLYNKHCITAQIKDILSKGSPAQHALVLLDIDHFKSFNDTFGHVEGDKIIKNLSQRLKSTFRKTDRIGRFGGDEFLILVQEMADISLLRCALSGLLRFHVDDFICTASIGVALFPQDGTTFIDLFQNADQALYRAKEKREHYVFFSELES